jgi:hypothetical protein
MLSIIFDVAPSPAAYDFQQTITARATMPLLALNQKHPE